MKFYFLPLVCMLLLSITSFSQKDLAEEASYLYDMKNYKQAYDLYDQLYTKNPKNFEYKSRLGFCALYYPEKKARAIEIFEDIKRNDKSPEADYYLAKAYHSNYKFDQAITHYQAFTSAKMGRLNEEDKQLLKDAKLGIMNCNNGKELMANNIKVDIRNIGSPINTEEVEGVPIISADESIMIYTYRGKKSTGGLLDDELKEDKVNGTYHEDIFIATRANDTTWGESAPIASLNTNGNDAAIALSPDGQMLFTFISNVKNPGDIMCSTYSGTEWSTPTKLNSNINSEYWEGSCSITADGRYLYFASERPGGFGGRDLYVSEKVNGDWGPAKNLGPMINTEYDDDAPFIHPDGITLFFSSEGHKSIGGYDIMYTIKKDNTWITPISMGVPLNTTEDDRFYVINAKGDAGYFSSNRAGAGGKGEQDIYTVTPGIIGERPVLALLKGSVYIDEKPVEAKIEVLKKDNNEVIGPYYANSKTGKYLMALSPGHIYSIKVSPQDMDPMEELITIEKLDKFVEIRKDFYFYTPDFEHKKNQISVNAILDSLLNQVANAEEFKNDAKTMSTIESNSNITKEPETNKTEPVVKNETQKIVPTQETKPVETPCNGGPIPDFSMLKGRSLNDPSVYKQLLEIGGNMCIDGMVFKVQVAAYRHPENYNYSHLAAIGKPDEKNYPDGITRFTLLSFNTIKEAEKARQKMIAKGQKDAWIVGFVGEKRYSLEELIMTNFNAKAIN